MSKPLFRCLFFLIFAIICLPLFSAGNAENIRNDGQQDSKNTVSATSAPESQKKAAESEKKPLSTGDQSDTAAAPASEQIPENTPPKGEQEKPEGGTGTESADTDKKTPDKDSPDTSFSSIQSKGLTVAQGTKWYYENFDRFGRSVFAVEYENGSEIEKTMWSYTGTARHPTEKKIYRTDTTEIIRYDDAGRTLLIETYNEKKTLISKTENTYNTGGQLIEQIVTAGKNTDKAIWDFAAGKAVSQTKYRNGKKTAFIELHGDTRIVHLYMDDQEVLVTEE